VSTQYIVQIQTQIDNFLMGLNPSGGSGGGGTIPKEAAQDIALQQQLQQQQAQLLAMERSQRPQLER
jgi:hypothetical protein